MTAIGALSFFLALRIFQSNDLTWSDTVRRGDAGNQIFKLEIHLFARLNDDASSAGLDRDALLNVKSSQLVVLSHVPRQKTAYDKKFE